MGEFSVLHAEPRYKVEEFVAEMLGRARQVMSEMGAALEGLLRDMIFQFQTFKARNYLITLNDVQFEWVRWTPDGLLLIEFSADPRVPRKRDPEPVRHEIIEGFVDEVVGRSVPEELRSEFSGFLRGMVEQFAALKKHSLAIELNHVKFEQIRWLDDRRLVVKITHRGEPFTPRTARWV